MVELQLGLSRMERDVEHARGNFQEEAEDRLTFAARLCRAVRQVRFREKRVGLVSRRRRRRRRRRDDERTFENLPDDFGQLRAADEPPVDEDELLVLARSPFAGEETCWRGRFYFNPLSSKAPQKPI